MTRGTALRISQRVAKEIAVFLIVAAMTVSIGSGGMQAEDLAGDGQAPAQGAVPAGGFLPGEAVHTVLLPSRRRRARRRKAVPST